VYFFCNHFTFVMIGSDMFIFLLEKNKFTKINMLFF
jgi:hypothetical protein